MLEFTEKNIKNANLQKNFITTPLFDFSFYIVLIKKLFIYLDYEYKLIIKQTNKIKKN